MKSLKELLNKLNYEAIIGSIDVTVSNLEIDSNNVRSSTMFVAIRGGTNDGHSFILDAINSGAIAIVCEELPITKRVGVTYIKVNNTTNALSVLANNFFNHPSKKIKLIGITGTNGKTSTAYYLYSLFLNLNFKVGLISTIENKIHTTSLNSTHTTPNSIEINRLLSLMVLEECQFCFMEVSSHGIAQNRILGLDFDMAVFTNISRDHLDYHDSFNDYVNTKKRFFDILSEKVISIVNIDDPYSSTILMDTRSKKILYGIKSIAHYKASILENTIHGLNLNINGQVVSTKLIGGFNAYNLLATYSVAKELDIHDQIALNSLSGLNPVPGRFNVIHSSLGVVGVIDYAHTPDALKKVISSISKFCSIHKNLIIVIGCGGDRDSGKRRLMGKIAYDNSSLTIFTSDNPRSEDPKTIINDMLVDIPSSCNNHVYKIVDREVAIQFAVKSASKESIILIAGKGHEKFQEINGKKRPFDDFKMLHKLLDK